MSEEDVQSQFVVVLSASKTVWLPGVVLAVLVADDSPTVAAVITAISLVFAAMLLKPVRLNTSESGPALGVLRGFRWEWWRSDDVASIQYAHWPGTLRGTASMRFRTVDGIVVYLPGTSGRMLWTSPNLENPVASNAQRVRLLRTSGFLRLVHNSFDLPIETDGAEWFSPARPE